MRNSMKVAKWEYKRNIKNKSFLISLVLTPVFFILFATLPTLLSNLGGESDGVMVFIQDDVNVSEQLEAMVDQSESIDWTIKETTLGETAMLKQLKESENAVYIQLTEEAVESGTVPVYTSENVDDQFFMQIQMLKQPLLAIKFEQLELTPEQQKAVTQGVAFTEVSAEEAMSSDGGAEAEEDPMKRIVPGAFAGIILFSIVITGMMIFQSASQEKKEKVAEIVLSSLTPGELMQGKIIGYFGLGLTQVIVWAGLALPIAIWKLDDIPILEYLLVPELLVLIFIAVAGYLLFAAIFVGFGATVEDMNSSSNFQGMVLMLPFLPFIFIGPILVDPNGLPAIIGSYIPVTAPGVLLIRLSMLETWPWTQIIISLVILLISVWVFMKLAGKIFKVGILMYGKNATPKEIWKWLRA